MTESHLINAIKMTARAWDINIDLQAEVKRRNLMNKIYIAGCGGMLGEAFYKQFINSNILKCTDIDINEDWLSFLDFRNYNDYENDV